jgi:hypothetical protein
LRQLLGEAVERGPASARSSALPKSNSVFIEIADGLGGRTQLDCGGSMEVWDELGVGSGLQSR